MLIIYYITQLSVCLEAEWKVRTSDLPDSDSLSICHILYPYLYRIIIMKNLSMKLQSSRKVQVWGQLLKHKIYNNNYRLTTKDG